MKTSAAAQLALFTASAMAAGSSTCAIDCFQGLITNGPPMQCKEATNYLCFCTMPTLQDGFVQCVNKDCGDEKDAAIGWANDLCKKLGHPIDLDTPEGSPKTDETTDSNAPPTSTSNKAKETTEAQKASTTEAAQTTTTEPDHTASKTQNSSDDETSEQLSETTAIELTSAAANSTSSIAKNTASKPKETAESQGSDSAEETTAERVQPTGDSVATFTGSATPSSTSGSDDSNVGNFVAAPDFLVAAGAAAAVWQLL
ncbi:hypothetical protein FSARC_7732 [Fusarium sarcochroum]|uniref:CFEM domain-containing protein n=1 Tax=Fusarium sarcochroum TaxID=1208366 RepID=A0A8H4TUD0_9HYPO|nr:hypothetical protein FSARC_7732 [Fusarium sarcochroum]